MSLCFFGLPGPLLTVGVSLSKFKLSAGTFASNLSNFSRFGMGSDSFRSWVFVSVVVCCLFFVVIEVNEVVSDEGVFLGRPRPFFRVAATSFF